MPELFEGVQPLVAICLFAPELAVAADSYYFDEPAAAVVEPVAADLTVAADSGCFAVADLDCFAVVDPVVAENSVGFDIAAGTAAAAVVAEKTDCC